MRKRKIWALALMILVIFSPWASGNSKCKKLLVQKAHDLPLTPWGTLTQEEAQQIRTNPSLRYWDYRYAYWFAKLEGDKFADYVFGDVRNLEVQKRPLNIVIAMGGAEPLSIMLRLMALQRGITNVRFIELYLTRPIVRPWEGRESLGAFRVGFGEPPHNVKLTFPRPLGANTDEEIMKYVRQNGTFKDTKEVVVVDTGMNGTILEGISQLGNQLKFKGKIRGAMLAHNGQRVTNSIRIDSLNKGRIMSPSPLNPYWWAFIMDNGSLTASEGGSGFGFGFGFQRSHSSATKLILDANGMWQPDIRSITDPIEIKRHQAVILGLSDAIFNRWPEDKVPFLYPEE